MSENGESKRRVAPSQAAMNFFLAMGRDRALRIVPRGADALTKELEETWTTSLDMMRSLEKRVPEWYETLCTVSGVDQAELSALLEVADFEAEPRSKPMRLGEEREPMRSPISDVLREGMRSAARAAGDAGAERRTLGVWVSRVLADDRAIAAQALRKAGASEEGIARAVAWLDAQPEPESPRLTQQAVFADIRQVSYSAIAALIARNANEENGRPSLRRLYEENPEKYQVRPVLADDLALAANSKWPTAAGMVSKAARWEALHRKAPEVTLTHLLLALLQDGTDTSAFFERRGIDRAAVVAELDRIAPRFDEGPAFPEDSPQLVMTLPGDPRIPHHFTDLLYLVDMFHHEEEPAVAVLNRLGITRDEVRYEAHCSQTGDREWHLRRPDLRALLIQEGTTETETPRLRTHFCREAADYEARLRGAVETVPSHVLLALLVDGTDFSAFLASRGVDRAELVRRLDESLPRQAMTVYVPKDTVEVNSAFFGCEFRLPFTDLRIVEGLLSGHDFELGSTPWRSILSETGITLDAVRAALPPTRDLIEEFKKQPTE